MNSDEPDIYPRFDEDGNLMDPDPDEPGDGQPDARVSHQGWTIFDIGCGVAVLVLLAIVLVLGAVFR
ncbi:MAG: hypothetical protein HYX69_01045 [Planctomycetia bacterium]|nr:hypothetical protein [Planctomycetia bacterium]